MDGTRGDPRQYQSYLLRLWRSGHGSPFEWRLLLEDTRNGQRRGFATLDGLYAYLAARTDQAGRVPSSQEPGSPPVAESPTHRPGDAAERRDTSTGEEV